MAKSSYEITWETSPGPIVRTLVFKRFYLNESMERQSAATMLTPVSQIR